MSLLAAYEILLTIATDENENAGCDDSDQTDSQPALDTPPHQAERLGVYTNE